MAFFLLFCILTRPSVACPVPSFRPPILPGFFLFFFFLFFPFSVRTIHALPAPPPPNPPPPSPPSQGLRATSSRLPAQATELLVTATATAIGTSSTACQGRCWTRLAPEG